MNNNLLKGLNEEQIKKAKACKDQNELLALAKEEGITLSDEQLEAVSGGFCSETTSVRNVNMNGDQINLKTYNY